MIIECPACKTRYDIKAQLPAQGRTVRCAKCGNVWRATPAVEAAPDTASSTEEQFEAGPAASTGPGQMRAQAAETDDQAAAALDASAGETESGQAAVEAGPFSAGPPLAAEASPAGPESIGWHDPSPPALPGNPAWRDEDEGSAGEAEDKQEPKKVRWFGGFMRRSRAKQAGSGGAEAADAAQSQSAGTIPFPSRAPAAGHPPHDAETVRTLDEARAAVRGVFASLGEHRPAAGGRAFQTAVGAEQELETRSSLNGEAEPQPHAPEPGAAPAWLYGSHEDRAAGETAAPGWTQEAGTETAGAEEGQSESVAGGAAWPAFGKGAQDRVEENSSPAWMKGWQDSTEEAEDPDAQLRDSLLARFPGGAAAGTPKEEGIHFRPFPGADAGEGEESARFAPPWLRQTPLAGELEGEAPVAEEPAGENEGEVSFDPRLFKEIEETQGHMHQPQQPGRRGSLALAAAWGLFLCVAGGLIVGLFGFRDIAAEALPGLAPFYRAIGMPVTLQPLTFEGVQYDWTVADYKPVLVIKGTVYNQAQRNVKVPGFVITIKDDDPALDREYSANLPAQGSHIKPGERTDFVIELVSPSLSITAVELELQNVR